MLGVVAEQVAKEHPAGESARLPEGLDGEFGLADGGQTRHRAHQHRALPICAPRGGEDFTWVTFGESSTQVRSKARLSETPSCRGRVGQGPSRSRRGPT